MPLRCRAARHRLDLRVVAQIAPACKAAVGQLTKAQQALDITEYNARALRNGFAVGQAPKVIVDVRPDGFDGSVK